MKTIHFLLIIFLILTASCRRKGDASGKVINILNGEPVAGIEVSLNEYKVKMITDKTVTRPIGNTTTDANGEYAFKYGARLGRNGHNRIITLTGDQFLPMDTTSVIDEKYDIGNYPGCETTKWDYSGHSRKNQDFYIAPLSRIKVIPHNVTHMYDGVTLRIDLYDDNYSVLAGYYSNGVIGNTNYYTQFPSDGKIYIVWQLQSTYQNFYDTIHVEPFKKVTYHFNY